MLLKRTQSSRLWFPGCSPDLLAAPCRVTAGLSFVSPSAAVTLRGAPEVLGGVRGPQIMRVQHFVHFQHQRLRQEWFLQEGRAAFDRATVE